MSHRSSTKVLDESKPQGNALSSQDTIATLFKRKLQRACYDWIDTRLRESATPFKYDMGMFFYIDL